MRSSGADFFGGDGGRCARAPSGESLPAVTTTALNPFLDPGQTLTLREWYVYVHGGETVGPVSADQIARGIRAKKVPGDAQVVRVGDTRWEDVLDSPAVLAALKAL